MKFKNKIVVVTGAAGGIGRSCCLAFASEGASLVCADIDIDNAEVTAEIITRQGGVAIASETNVARQASVIALVEKTIKEFGKVDVLVNNAAIQINKTVPDTDFEEWNLQMAINVGGVFLCSKFFLPFLIKSKGCIVNMSSVNSYFVEVGCAGYCATKAAIVGLTKAMAIDHGPDGVRINCICPGYIDAGLAEGYFESQPNPESARQNAGKLHALWRIGKPGEVANVALFLASDDASFVTGSSYVVDGGFGSGLPRM